MPALKCSSLQLVLQPVAASVSKTGRMQLCKATAPLAGAALKTRKQDWLGEADVCACKLLQEAGVLERELQLLGVSIADTALRGS